MKWHKIWLEEKCSRYFDQRKQAKMQWLQDPNKSNVYNLNNLRRKDSRNFRSKTNKYLKPKTGDLETNSKIKNIRDLYKASMTLRRVTSL